LSKEGKPVKSSPTQFALRSVITLAVLVLIGWFAWRSIPARQIIFSEKELATNRQLALQAKFISPPTSISTGYTVSDQGVQLVKGGTIIYALPRTEGFLQGVFQVENINGGKVQIKAEGKGRPTVLLERVLSPSTQDADRTPFHFLINLATLPPDINRLVLTTADGTVNWRETGFVDGHDCAGFAQIPLPLLAVEGFLPGWDGKTLLVQSPTRLIFRAPAGKHRLSFRYGVNPALFSDPHAATDGIGFKMELTSDGKTRELSNRVLEPFSRPTDRQLRSISLLLDLTEPGQLSLTATPGPNSNISWDWSVWDEFRLDPLTP
jgi:hypothetical protein